METVKIRSYKAEDVPAMADIWNQVVEEGTAFPQESKLTPSDAAVFSHLKPIAPLPRGRNPKRFTDCTFCTRTISDAAGIFPMPVTPLTRLPAVCISVSSWCVTASGRQVHMGFGCSNSMPSLPTTFTPAICTDASGFTFWVRFPADSARMTEILRTSACITLKCDNTGFPHKQFCPHE